MSYIFYFSFWFSLIPGSENIPILFNLEISIQLISLNFFFFIFAIDCVKIYETLNNIFIIIIIILITGQPYRKNNYIDLCSNYLSDLWNIAKSR